MSRRAAFATPLLPAAALAAFVLSTALAAPGHAPAPTHRAAPRPGAHRAAAGDTREALPAIPIARVSGPQPSFAQYQLLLNGYVHVDSPKDSALATSFNYERFYDERTRPSREARIRAEFMAIPPSQMDSLTRIAWAINFYNYLVVEMGTNNLLIPGKIRQRWLSLRDIKLDGVSFFGAPAVTIDSVTYSLDGFEKHFLFKDFDHAVGAKPPDGLDPRIHFALVCGARSCPPLQPRAFKPESLDYQLDRTVRAALASERLLTQDPQSGIIKLSMIFNWYVSDFGGREKLLPWILPYAPPRRRAAVRTAIARDQFALIPYDWALNQALGWRYEEEMRSPISAPKPAARDTT